MFYFDEDHMENGFDAPEVSDREEDQAASKHGQLGGVGGREQRSPGNGRPSQGSGGGWQRASNSGSTTTSSAGSYCGGRFSPETTSRRSPSGRSAGFELGRESEVFRPIGGVFDGLDDDCDSESEEQPAELVPLGMRTLNLTGCKNRHRHRKARSNFHDFYKLTEEHLGSGAYASVRTGVSIATGREFAVKLVDKHEPGHTRARIMREVEIFNMCKNHPNIVQLHEWFEDHDYFYMVFEKMRGGPLLNHIQQKGFFTEQEASKVTRDIATALKFLHDRGIAHRDVKPENVLCSDFDHVSPVKLCDLDLASKAAPPSPPKLPSVNSEPDLASPVGSAEFMAPEVVDAFVGDALKYDKRCDMWSLGVIVYIMICGYPPFYGQCWRENCGWDQGLSCNDCQENLFKRIQRGEFDFPDPEWENVSEEVKDLICHLLVKNVRDRFTADEVLKHPWIRNGAPDTKLQTPGNLFRNDSARDMHQMQEHFNVMSRIVAARLSSKLDNIPNEASSDEELPAIEKKKESLAETEVDNTTENASERDVQVAAGEQNNSADRMNSVATVVTPTVVTAKLGDIATQRTQSPGAALAPPPHGAASQVAAPTPLISLMQHSAAPPQLPLHVSQMAMGNPYVYGGGIPSGVALQPVPFHPNQLINMNGLNGINGLLLYPHPLVAPQVFPQHFTPQQQMMQYKFGLMPQQFMAPPPASSGGGGLAAHCTSGYYSPANMGNGEPAASGAHAFFVKRSGGPNGASAMLTVQSAAALAAAPQVSEQLETCQTAMARQDSKGDLPPQTRETQVNV